MGVITVHGAVPDDVPALVALLEERDRFYGATGPEPDGERTASVRDALFGSSPAARVLLARDGGEPAGLASYTFLWPAAGVTRSFYVKELYVRAVSRRRGVGRLLMAELGRIAATHRCTRIEWTTEADNLGARRFYASLGAQQVVEKVFYRLPQ